MATMYPNAIYDKCLNGYEIIEYNGNKKGDWFHTGQCPYAACLPTPYKSDDIKFINGAWQSVELLADYS